jgi:hypothetical protein
MEWDQSTQDITSDNRLYALDRPNNDECYSDEDLEILELFPEYQDQKYMEINLKIAHESQRKVYLSQLQSNNPQTYLQ